MPEQFTRPLLVLSTASRRRRDPEPAGGRADDREDRLSRALHSLAIQVRQLRR